MEIMEWKNIKYLAIFLSIIIIDLITKLFLVTPIEVQHSVDKSKSIKIIISIVALFVAFHIFNIINEKSIVPLIMALSAATCNFFDSLDSTIQNPFIVFLDKDTILGFNFADIIVVISTMMLIPIVTNLFKRRFAFDKLS
jgi:lipoprotein signal peptidase